MLADIIEAGVAALSSPWKLRTDKKRLTCRSKVDVVKQIGQNRRLGRQIVRMLPIRPKCALRVAGVYSIARPFMLSKEASKKEHLRYRSRRYTMHLIA